MAVEGRRREALPTSEKWLGRVQYDWQSQCLGWRGGRQFQLPPRFDAVIRRMCDKSADGTRGVLGALAYKDVAICFELGRLREKFPTITEAALEDRLRGRLPDLREPGESKQLAQEFARQIKRWLMKNGIPGEAVLRCSRRSDA